MKIFSDDPNLPYLTDMILGRVADLEEPDSAEVVEGQKKFEIMLDESS